MAGAVVVVEAGFPQRHACKGVDLCAGGAFGKARGRDADMAFQHAGEAVAFLRAGRADGDGARDVGRPVHILRAGIDEEEFAGFRRHIGRVRHAVMHDGAVRARAGNRVEAHIFQFARLRAESFKPLRRVDFRDAALWCFRGDPFEEFRQRLPVA